MDNDQQKRKIAKRIIIAAVALVAVIAVGLGVALLFKNVSKLAQDQSSTTPGISTQTPAAPSAASVINEYIDPQTIRIFTSSYQLQQDNSAPSRIMYKADDKKYEVSLSTDHYALFYAKDGASKNDGATVESQTTFYMQEKGYQKITSSDPSLVTYVNRGGVCQLTKTPGSTPAYYLMACADKADVEKEYATIEQLLALYKKDNKLDSFSRALSVTITADNKAMTTIRLTTTPDKHPLLLFAAVDGDWAYLGDLGSGDASVSNGKYSLTPQIQTAIHQAKYGDFLASNLQ